jgi:enediyne biosynthesis protein E4
MSSDPTPPETGPAADESPLSESSILRRRNVIAVGLLLLVCAAAGVYFASKYFDRKPAVENRPEIPKSGDRAAVPVPNVVFTDVTDAAKIAFTHYNGAAGKKLLPETMGGGVCILDYDGDGRQDILFVNGCSWPGHPAPEKPAPSCLTLYRNNGDGTFADVTVAAGLNVVMYGMGACAGDYDNDGYPDLFVTGVGGCKLYRNGAGGGSTRVFTDATASAGITTQGAWPGSLSATQFLDSNEPIEFATAATFVDYDGDGKLDLFACRYVTWSPAVDLSINATTTGVGRAYLQPQQFEGAQCALYRNTGGGKFADVSDAAGVTVVAPEGTGPNARQRPVAKSLGVVICDPDGDGWPDLMVANDTVRNFFFHNRPDSLGGRRYEEKAELVNAARAEARARGAMGIDWGEYLPGKHGAIIANFANEPITFLTVADASKPRFIDSALAVGLAGPSRFWLKFGTFFFDYDLDGRLDLLVCNGHLEPEIARIQTGQQYAQPPQLFWNAGDPARVFEPVTPEAGGAGLFRPIVGRGCAYFDYDDDGDLDIVLVENGGRARLLRNDTKLGNHFVRLTLAGDGKTANSSAIGAEVTVEAGGRTFKREVAGTRGYLSQSELPVTIGLGSSATVDRVTVRWPGKDAGAAQVWTNLKANAAYTLRQGRPDAEPAKK